MTQPPFRWNLARREQLGSLLNGAEAEDYPEFVEDLRACCVRLLALAGDADLIFVGRSPESIFDYLSGLLADTSWSERCVLVNLSMRHDTVESVERTYPQQLRALQEQLRGIRLDPARIAGSDRPQVFVDLVSMGDTFGNLAGLLAHWAGQSGVDVRAVRRRIRFIGITVREKNSPNAWRWYQKVDWAADFPPSSLQSVSIPFRLWTYLGDYQKKVGRWYPPFAWGMDVFNTPPRESWNLEALRLAARIHDLGRQPAERERVAREIAARPEMSKRGIRALVSELR
jgi:hypothetical protein